MSRFHPRAVEVTREDIVAEARSWIGTPFLWQASVRGKGCDCKGLIAGIARHLGLPEAESIAAKIANYDRAFKPEQLIAGLEASMIRTHDPKPGDVVAIVIEPNRYTLPRHLALLTSETRIVHCYGLGAIKRVIEVPLGRSRPIHSYWTWPSLAGANGA